MVDLTVDEEGGLAEVMRQHRLAVLQPENDFSEVDRHDGGDWEGNNDN